MIDAQAGQERYLRRVAIIRLLQAAESMSAPELADQIDASIRVIQQDIESLVDAGLLAASDDGPPPKFSTIVANAASTESLAGLGLFLLSLLDPPVIPVVSTTQQILDQQTLSRFYFDSGRWYWSGRGSQLISKITRAILYDLVVEVDYKRAGSSNSRSHTMEPYGLVWKDGNWYLVARLTAGQVRSFRLDRIDSLTVTNSSFEYPATAFGLRTWWHQNLEEFGKGDVRAVIRASGGASERLKSLSLKSTSELHELEDGSLFITLYVDKWEWLIPLLCQFGDQVEVLEPRELRSAVVGFLSSALRVYGSPSVSVVDQ